MVVHNLILGLSAKLKIGVGITIKLVCLHFWWSEWIWWWEWSGWWAMMTGWRKGWRHKLLTGDENSLPSIMQPGLGRRMSLENEMSSSKITKHTFDELAWFCSQCKLGLPHGGKYNGQSSPGEWAAGTSGFWIG